MKIKYFARSRLVFCNSMNNMIINIFEGVGFEFLQFCNLIKNRFSHELVFNFGVFFLRKT